MRFLKSLIPHASSPYIFALQLAVVVFILAVLIVGCITNSRPVQASTPDLKRFKVVEDGPVDGIYGPWASIIEDTQTGEHYALAYKGSSVAWIKLSK
jgi:hypothetical protein